jgi:hypothetical protein
MQTNCRHLLKNYCRIVVRRYAYPEIRRAVLAGACDPDTTTRGQRVGDLLEFIHSQALIVQDGPLASLFGVS